MKQEDNRKIKLEGFVNEGLKLTITRCISLFIFLTLQPLQLLHLSMIP
jgi:hypothetical protein